MLATFCRATAGKQYKPARQPSRFRRPAPAILHFLCCNRERGEAGAALVAFAFWLRPIATTVAVGGGNTPIVVIELAISVERANDHRRAQPTRLD